MLGYIQMQDLPPRVADTLVPKQVLHTGNCPASAAARVNRVGVCSLRRAKQHCHQIVPAMTNSIIDVDRGLLARRERLSG